MESDEDRRPEVGRLLAAIKANLPSLETLLATLDEHWGLEDGFYRFYHQSFKVYGVQPLTTGIVDALAALRPEAPLNQWFLAIVAEGTGKHFEQDHNRVWLSVTRPMVEALFHARYFLQMVCKYGREFEAPPAAMPSGWAAVLYLFNLR